jgi:hypothetical protein
MKLPGFATRKLFAEFRNLSTRIFIGPVDKLENMLFGSINTGVKNSEVVNSV